VVRDELLRLESALASRDPTGVEGGLMSLIAEDFVEFGTSGRTWTARSIREVLEAPRGEAVPIEDFEVAELGDGVVLATYVISGPPSVNRSSIWMNRGGRRLFPFHQGTPRTE
jgi:hypothetical protein